MAEEASGVTGGLIGLYNEFLATLPGWMGDFINLMILVVFVVVFSIFIWKFHKFISKKNFLNLNKIKHKHSGKYIFSDFWQGVIYIVENIIVIPFFIFFWFAIFTFFLILLTSDAELATILIISAIVISAIRMTAYYKEDLSREIAKLLPFTLLSVAILTPGFFSLDRVVGRFSQLSTFFSDIIIYLLFIAILEIILRFFDFIFSMIGFEQEDEEKILD